MKYSPAFGEANISDFFISFKNLSNSYSMLGNVYKLPPKEDGETFLAGKKNFVKGKHELLPIPQKDIDMSNGVLTQNSGY